MRILLYPPPCAIFLRIGLFKNITGPFFNKVTIAPDKVLSGASTPSFYFLKAKLYILNSEINDLGTPSKILSLQVDACEK